MATNPGVSAYSAPGTPRSAPGTQHSALSTQHFSLPPWYPDWAQRLADLYFSGTTCLFILHGNVHDVVYAPSSEGGDDYTNLARFLADQVFGSWDVVLQYDLGNGLRPQAGRDAARLQTMLRYLTSRLGDPGGWPRDPANVLLILDKLVERNLVEEDPARRKCLAVILDYAQYLAPAGDLASLARGQGAGLVHLLGWAQNPYIKRVNTCFCLVAEKLSEVNDRLVQNPHCAAIEIPMPDREERRRFVEWSRGMSNVECRITNEESAIRDAVTGTGGQAAERMSNDECRMSNEESGSRGAGTGSGGQAGSGTQTGTGGQAASGPQVASAALAAGGTGDAASEEALRLAELSAGLTLVGLNVVMSQARQAGAAVDALRFRELKKSLIERQCQGLVSFVEPRHTLDLVVGHEAAKGRLAEDAALLARGRLDAAPMGYLLCGPVGTGKTFLAECTAGSIGIPCVTLRNFRSKYVGETEGNLEQVLTVLRSLGPVMIIIDEADAALGSRSAEGDSGTSSRVFSMIAAQMGDTRYRGRILWMLLTCRPDLLPIDLKRQGRAEVHIPLFYPQDDEETREMFRVMARKNKVDCGAISMPPLPAGRLLSGADIESIVLSAHRKALAAGRLRLESGDLEWALHEFMPSVQGLEKELQELAAVLECTQLSFLPPDWRQRVTGADGRAALQHRLVEIRRMLDE